MDLTSILSISVFVVLVVAEIIVSTKKQTKLYSKKDTATNLVLGTFTFLSKVGLKGLLFLFYMWVYQFVPWKFAEDSLLALLVVFLLNDLMFYWYHRIGHERRAMWALHVAHHSSKEMNITVALRGNFLNNILHAVIWLSLVLLGFHPLMVLAVDAFAYFYQLWLHTKIIGKLGVLEWVINTPSHHRVHHGTNEKYIDKNYGAVLIVWDRLFGTFQKEEEEVAYGITKQLKSETPWHVAFHEMQDIYKDMKKAKNWKTKWKILLSKPGYGAVK